MARYRPIRTQRDAAVVLAEDFARAARSMGDMSNFYRWRNVAAQHRVLSGVPLEPLDPAAYRILWNDLYSMDRPDFKLT